MAGACELSPSARHDGTEKLAERGITGQVVAKALFDELIKRRKTVTTLVRPTMRVSRCSR